MQLDTFDYEDLWTIERVARRYGLSKSTIWERLRRDEFPEPLRLGTKCTRWRLADLVAWEREQMLISKRRDA